MIKGLHHTGLTVRDLDRSVAYFETQGAFQCVMRFDVEDTPDTRGAFDSDAAAASSALLKGPTGFLELNQFATEPQAERRDFAVNEAGIRHVCLQDKDVDTFFDAHVAAGASWHARPVGLGTGALYAYVRDPEGNVLELEGVPWCSTDGVKPWYAHTALVTSDIDRLSAFYESVTEVDCHRRGRFGPHRNLDTVAGLEGVDLKAAWLKLALGVVEMWEYASPPTVPQPRPSMTMPGWSHICFQVDDVEAEYERIRGLGIETHGAPVSNSFGSSVYGRDPDGNIFEMLEPKADVPDLSIDHLEGLEFLKVLQDDVETFYKAS